ncbi:MAG: hypothetical protein Sylvanvirus1_88 [Sylvanvirus sp.]|uniref:F-box domain-containing protein n=1 Tax=Sylvanvirus sp. TaxID=2487774 RepID=A0A3G5AH15_9VIRU|nr:MAG: hypothetical protein Sylvanvirus1_88 [Sylvanvirus sp.]
MSMFFAWSQICHYLKFNDLFILSRCRNKFISRVLKSSYSWKHFEFHQKEIGEFFRNKMNYHVPDFLNKFILHIQTWVFSNDGTDLNWCKRLSIDGVSQIRFLDPYKFISGNLKQGIYEIVNLVDLRSFRSGMSTTLDNLTKLSYSHADSMDYLGSTDGCPRLHAVRFHSQYPPSSLHLNAFPAINELEITCCFIYFDIGWPFKYITQLQICGNISWKCIWTCFPHLKILKAKNIASLHVMGRIYYDDDMDEIIPFLDRLEELELCGSCDTFLLRHVVHVIRSDPKYRSILSNHSVYDVLVSYCEVYITDFKLQSI